MVHLSIDRDVVAEVIAVHQAAAHVHPNLLQVGVVDGAGIQRISICYVGGAAANSSSSERRQGVQLNCGMGDKGAISIAQKYRKRPIGAIGASNIGVPVLVKISRPGRARFLPDSRRLPLREFAGAISEVNEQIRAFIMLDLL